MYTGVTLRASSNGGVMRSACTLVASCVVLALVGCGGGGGGDDGGDTPAASIAGFWDGDDFALLTTPGGELWGVEQAGGELVLYRGTYSTSGNDFNSDLGAYLLGQRVAATARGTFVQKTSITGRATVPNVGSSDFTVRYNASYDAAPSLAAIGGTYDASTGGSLTISPTGAINGTVEGCPLTGSASLDASGKNFYRVTVTFGSTGCALPNATATGVAAPSVGNRLVAGVISGNVGTALLLTKR